MAKRQVVTYIHTCDVCGEVIPDDDQAASTQKVSVQGVDYIVELCAIHRPTFTEALSVVETYASKGQRVGGRKMRAPGVRPPAPNRPISTTAGRSKDEMQAIRHFARMKGMKVSDRGRIPAEVIHAYDSQGKTAPAETPKETPKAIAEAFMAQSNGAAPKARRPRKTAAPVSAETKARNPITRSPRATASV